MWTARIKATVTKPPCEFELVFRALELVEGRVVRIDWVAERVQSLWEEVQQQTTDPLSLEELVYFIWSGISNELLGSNPKCVCSSVTCIGFSNYEIQYEAADGGI